MHSANGRFYKEFTSKSAGRFIALSPSTLTAENKPLSGFCVGNPESYSAIALEGFFFIVRQIPILVTALDMHGSSRTASLYWPMA